MTQWDLWRVFAVRPSLRSSRQPLKLSSPLGVVVASKLGCHQFLTLLLLLSSSLSLPSTALLLYPNCSLLSNITTIFFVCLHYQLISHFLHVSHYKCRTSQFLHLPGQ